mgnify:CR=1 FL=1
MVGKTVGSKQILPFGSCRFAADSGLILPFTELAEEFVDLFLVRRRSVTGGGTGRRLRAPLGSGFGGW